MVFRTRMALAMISVSVIGLEITLMRVLALRFWTYFAAMVISVALLGFGFSGTTLALVQTRLRPYHQLWLSVFAFSSALSVLLCAWAVQQIPLDVHYLPWNLSAEMLHILEIECLMMIPFFFTGIFLGLALMDHPERIHGHYAANLAGSGAGAFLSVGLMFYLSTTSLLILWAFLCYGAGLCLIDWRHARSLLGSMVMGGILLIVSLMLPSDVHMSSYKKLSQEKSKPNSKVIHSGEGPLGRIDIVKGPALHDAPPGMSLQNPYSIPKRSLLIMDGDQTHIVYTAEKESDWQFLDYTTTALPFALDKFSKVLIFGPGGGAPLALANHHGSKKIVALEPNRQMVQLLRSPFTGEGKSMYDLPQVQVLFEEPRSFLRRSKMRYDLILIPLLEPAGMEGAGLLATQENYLYTLESFRSCLRHLNPSGMLCVTVYSKIPPRDGIRLFNLALEALLQEKYFARDHLALIRSWETVTLLMTKTPLTLAQLQSIRKFSDHRSFDLCYLPDLTKAETNQYHVLPEPYYFEGAQALLGASRENYLKEYLFSLGVPTDDRPYFNHFMRWKSLPHLKKQLKGRMPAFLELGSLFLAAALFQVAALAALLIFLPLFPDVTGLKKVRQKGRILLYFFLLGLGFMLLEMSFLQKMILYLGHPIYSAAVVIASFLIFSGLGSQLSGIWAGRSAIAACSAGFFVALTSGFYLIFLDSWLGSTQNQDLIIRFLVISVTIAPLAFAMGHLFPIGLRHVSEAFPAMVPWCWASNGFASVLATAAAPLVAMSIGFSKLILIAMGCYVLAGLWMCTKSRFIVSGSQPVH